MARHCVITNKKTASGNNVSHAHNRTKRRFYPNIQKVSFYSDILRQKIRLSISTQGLRTIERHGGIEAWLRKARPTDPILNRLKKRIHKAEQLNLGKKENPS